MEASLRFYFILRPTVISFHHVIYNNNEHTVSLKTVSVISSHHLILYSLVSYDFVHRFQCNFNSQATYQCQKIIMIKNILYFINQNQR